MKNLIILSLVIFSVSAKATSLTCFTQKPLDTSVGPVTVFTLTDIEKDDTGMESSLPDQNTLSAFASDADGQVTGASFSNECDNEYDVGFKTNAFKSIVSGKVLSISGEIRFSSSDGTESSTLIDCQLSPL